MKGIDTFLRITVRIVYLYSNLEAVTRNW